ncbi:F0F1 ATP synthase subunit beta, partial [Candidatus Saccharibacteria bacterium]|nr:F0F1 ATP synthase subunit beta [Candidatus Saccharibacteria bacterium]
MTTKTKQSTGVISQVVGVVIDAEFADGNLPAIYNALTVELKDKKLVFEVAQHLSETSVRAIALGTTDGLERGTAITDSGEPITVPVGEETLGRMFDVVGEPIDGQAGTFKNRAPIHREPP